MKSATNVGSITREMITNKSNYIIGENEVLSLVGKEEIEAEKHIVSAVLRVGPYLYSEHLNLTAKKILGIEWSSTYVCFS